MLFQGLQVLNDCPEVGSGRDLGSVINDSCIIDSEYFIRLLRLSTAEIASFNDIIQGELVYRAGRSLILSAFTAYESRIQSIVVVQVVISFLKFSRKAAH